MDRLLAWIEGMGASQVEKRFFDRGGRSFTNKKGRACLFGECVRVGSAYAR